MINTIDTQEFEINGVTLNVVMDFEYMRTVLLAAEREWEERRFTEAWTVDEGKVTKDEYMGDIQATRDRLLSIKSDPSILEEDVKIVRKKKNGEFWSRSGVTIRFLNYVSEYYTDFTNSWQILQLRLKVVDPKTCELELVYKFETN